MAKEHLDLIESKIAELKKDYTSFKKMKNEHMFTILCMRYFFFSDESFNVEYLKKFLTDGANDGGIDAVFNDENSDGKDVVIMQSKYYPNTELTKDQVTAEVAKIFETITDFSKHKFQGYKEKVISVYQDADDKRQEEGVVRVLFFTSYKPSTAKKKESIINAANKTAAKYGGEVEFFFYEDILAEINAVDNAGVCVKKDTLEIDKPGNYLEYEDSRIFNISAHSLQGLRHRNGNALLGLNLRYYVRQQLVDQGIDKTIAKKPNEFWYKNNGVIIICRDFELDGKILRLEDFSVINGGQTTYKISRANIEKDFYIQCKVIKICGKTEEEKNIFSSEIAQATNTQKPIRQSDLVANAPEQNELAARLRKENVQYVIKRGDTIDKKKYPEPYQTTKLEDLGKLSLATALQMPGSARSSNKKMYNDNYRYSIFGSSAKAGLIADVLKIEYYYDLYKKQDHPYFNQTQTRMLKNGKYHVLACITFLFKIQNKVFTYNEIDNLLNNVDDLKERLRDMGKMERIIVNKLDDEKERFFKLFDKIIVVLADSYKEMEKSDKAPSSESNFLKTETYYYNNIIPKLNSYHQLLQVEIDEILASIASSEK